MRRRLFWLVPLFLLVVVAACEAAGWSFLREPAEHLLSRRLERTVRLEAPFHLRLLGGIELRLGGLWVAAPPGFPVDHLLAARQVAIDLRYRDLLAFSRERSLRIAHVGVDKADIALLRQADGSATWQFGKPAAESGKPPLLPSLGSLRIGESRLLFRDPRSRSDLEAAFTAGGEPGSAPRLRATAQGRLLGETVRLGLEASGWLPASPDQDADLPLQGHAVLAYGKGEIQADFDGHVSDPLGHRKIEGTLKAKGSSLGIIGELIDKPIPTTAPFVVACRFANAGEAWHVDVGEARVGDSLLNGRFTYDPAPDPPRLEGELGGKRFVLADLAPALGTRSPDGTPLAPQGGRVLPDRRLDLPSLKKLDARVKVDIERVDLGTLFAQPISPLRGSLSLKQGELSLNDVDAVTARGRLRGRLSINARRNPPEWRSAITWQGIRLEDWLRPPAATAGTGLAHPQTFIAGDLNGRASLSGSGHSTAELLATLDGQVTTFIRDGSLSHLAIEALGLDVAQGLGLVIKGDEALPIDCAVIDLKARQGVLSPDVAMIDTPVTLILGKGQVDLRRERLDLRLVARPKNLSPLTLRSPILVQGAFADPSVLPEPVPIAARVLGGLALAVVNPLAAILPFVDPGDGKESPCRRTLESIKR